jgi:hypothetical protein
MNDDPPLVAAACAVDITPQNLDRTVLAGFGLNRRARGVLDPLEASILYLRAGDTALAIVSLDLIGLGRPWIDAIRGRVSAITGTALLCGCTHTHSGPDTLGLWGRGLFGAIPLRSGVDRAYLQRTIESVARGLETCAARATPVRLRVADFEMPEHWTRNDRGGARFDTAVVAALETDDGERVATLLNYASHPETLWRDNALVSADFPGAYRRHTAELAGGISLYLSGPLGGMLTPDVELDASPQRRRDYAEALGWTLAETAHAALREAASQASPRLTHGSLQIALRNTNWRFSALRWLGLLETGLEAGAVRTELHRLRLGTLELLSAPGELVPELGARVLEQMTAPHRMIFGLCGEEVGYILEPAMFDDEEYAYEVTQSLGRNTAATLMRGYADLEPSSQP